MEPGVPFALLGAVLLLTVAACVGLGASAVVVHRGPPALLVVAGALVLAAVETSTALRLGAPASDGLALVRCAGALLLGAGLYARGLTRPPGVLPAVVVPLAAAAPPSLLAGAGGLLAAAAVLRGRRDAVGAVLSAGLALWAVAALLAADRTFGPVAVLAVRGAGSMVVLAALVLLARSSLLTKVVAVITAGVLATAVAVAAVVGSVVVAGYDAQSRAVVVQAASARLAALDDLGTQAIGEAAVLQLACGTAERCSAFLPAAVVGLRSDFVVRVPASGPAVPLAGRPLPSASELLGLRDAAPVRAAFAGRAAKVVAAVASPVRLTGARPALAVVAAAPLRGPNPDLPPSAVLVYGVRLDDSYAATDRELGGYGLTLLAGSPLQVVASNTSTDDRRRLLSLVRGAAADSGVASGGRTIPTQGTAPTVRLLPVNDLQDRAVGLLAVTRDATTALAAERQALRRLLITLLASAALVAAAALLLGRRIVEPVRRLTTAARRIGAGDLTGTGLRGGRDEVGTLTRTFDVMTGSLSRLTGDLRSTADRLETVLSSMSDGLLATDAEGVVTGVNPAALSMLGLEEQDVVGEPLGVVAQVRGAAGEQLADPALRLRDEPAEVHRPDGSRLPVRVAITALSGGDGVVLVLRDTTREREVERMKTEFLSNVSHELRTPLTPIRGYAEMLVAKPGLDPERVTTFATTIRDESIKMNRVVDLLVDVAALEAGRVSVSPRDVSAAGLLDARLEAWKARWPERAGDLRRRVASGLPLLHVDPSWLAKALDELVDNAVKYSPAGAAILLTAAVAPDGTRVRISVRDAGAGIAEQDRRRLFTSFEQVDGSATRRVGGLGLGLSFVRRVADDAGFPLTVLSTVGKGSEFALDLPVVAAPVPPERRTARRSSS